MTDGILKEAVSQVMLIRRHQNYLHNAATTQRYNFKIAFVVALCETIFCDRI